ncbi:hypothetical protein PR048_007461, partial [Dryococelus australis]
VRFYRYLFWFYASTIDMNPAEVEFLAEKNMVSIVPNFSFERIFLISGAIGPFRAGLPVNVPVWMAINLRQRQKCKIIPPDWMNVEKLEEAKEIESQSRYFTKMPSDHYMVEAHLLLQAASEDIPRADEIRTVLKDIWDMRMSKLRTSVDAFVKSGGSHAKLDHLTAMEVCSVRPLLPHALDQMCRLQKVWPPLFSLRYLSSCSRPVVLVVYYSAREMGVLIKPAGQRPYFLQVKLLVTQPGFERGSPLLQASSLCRNAKAREMEDLQTSNIVRHDSRLQKSGVIRSGIEPGSRWWGASSHRGPFTSARLSRVSNLGLHGREQLHEVMMIWLPSKSKAHQTIIYENWTATSVQLVAIVDVAITRCEQYPPRLQDILFILQSFGSAQH